VGLQHPASSRVSNIALLSGGGAAASVVAAGVHQAPLFVHLTKRDPANVEGIAFRRDTNQARVRRPRLGQRKQ